MQIKLEQVFYGRGQFGYGVLGASPNGKAFGDAVESLCESIGSPDAFLTWRPFLVNKRFGDYCLMCCVQAGKSDSCGRATVFYHVLIGLASELEAANFDAFVVYEKGLFVNDVVANPQAVLINGRSRGPITERPFPFEYPAVVSVSEAAPDLIKRLLGADAVRRSWATFAFHPMTGFDLYALNSRSTSPLDGVCYDSMGKVLSSSTSPKKQREQKMYPSNRSSVLRASLVINAILAIGVMLLIMGKLTTQPDATSVSKDRLQADENGQIEELKRDNERLGAANSELKAEVSRLKDEVGHKENPSVGLVSREVVIRELGEKFKVRYHGEPFDKLPSTSKKILNYIQFVNQEILNLQ